jgi:ketosteroid isomerase-like protein
MELPKLIARFIETQNNHDNKAFADCFTDSAIVRDEGKTHTGKAEIRQWIEHANDKYQSLMIPHNYEESGSKGVLTAEVSGTFPGSPIVLQFHFVLKHDLIDSLKVSG